MNYHHRRSNYAGGHVGQSLRPGGEWWRDLPPAITHGVAVSGMASPGIREEHPMDLKEILDDLKELEQVLALAEELRYRIVTALKTPPRDRQQPPPTSTNRPDLKRTGRGLFAWAREHGRVNELMAIGQKMKFPARIIDWDQSQIDIAITRIDAAETEIQKPAEPKRRFPSGRSRSNGHARVPGADDDRNDGHIPY